MPEKYIYLTWEPKIYIRTSNMQLKLECISLLLDMPSNEFLNHKLKVKFTASNMLVKHFNKKVITKFFSMAVFVNEMEGNVRINRQDTIPSLGQYRGTNNNLGIFIKRHMMDDRIE